MRVQRVQAAATARATAMGSGFQHIVGLPPDEPADGVTDGVTDPCMQATDSTKWGRRPRAEGLVHEAKRIKGWGSRMQRGC